MTIYYPQEEWESRGKMYDAYYCRNAWHRLKEDADRLQTLMASSGLKPELTNLTLDDILERGDGSKAMIAGAKSILDGRRYFMTVWGGPGNGKTQTLWAMTSEYLRRGQSAIYARVSSLLNHLRDGFDDNTFRTSDRYKQIISCYFLALDEPEQDKVNYTGWVKEVLFAIFDDRYLAAKLRDRATAIAMNADPETLPAYMVSRLRYDLHSDTGFIIVKNTDSDGRESGL